MFIIPIYLFSEIFPVWKTYMFAHLFFLHQGPFTSLAATDDFNHDGILLHNLVRSGSPGVWLTLNSIRLFFIKALWENWRSSNFVLRENIDRLIFREYFSVRTTPPVMARDENWTRQNWTFDFHLQYTALELSLARRREGEQGRF